MQFFLKDTKGVMGSALMQLISILAFYGDRLGIGDVYPTDYGNLLHKGQSFDIVIVGGGTAGCVLANRLSEISDWRVLVLEAGTIPSIDVEVPIFFSRIRNSVEDWSIKTEREENLCRGMPGRKCTVHVGKMLGGSTGLSNMHYERASQKYFMDWDIMYPRTADIHYENIEGYLGKNVNNRIGISGEIPISNLNNTHPADDLIFSSASLLGYQQVSNMGEPQLGYYFANGYVYQGERWNFAKAFLKNINKRGNLFIAQNALVSRIVTNNPVDNRVSGVDVIVNGNEFFVNSKLEVVLTSGAINTAKLLLLSGIGPADQIKKFRSIVYKDLCGVGKNYKDQIGVPIFISLDGESFKESTDFADATYSFLKEKKGPFTRINLNNIIAYINTQVEPITAPNIKILHYFYEPADTNFKQLISTFGYTNEIAKTILDRNALSAVVIIMPVLINPISTGEVLLRATNPFSPPIIKGNYLSDPTQQDLETLISSIRYAHSLANSEPFVKNGANVIYPEIAECRNYKSCTDKYWSCYVRNMGMPMSQGVGTVQAAREFTNCNICTDGEFLVKGVRHLRVVDSSVLPNCVPGSLDSTVAMLADKAASDIKKSWSK